MVRVAQGYHFSGCAAQLTLESGTCICARIAALLPAGDLAIATAIEMPAGGHPYPAAGQEVPRPGQDDAQGSVTAPGSRGPGHAGPDRAQAAGKPGSSGTAARGPDLAEPLEPLPLPKKPGNDKSMAGFLAATDSSAERDDEAFAEAWGKPDRTEVPPAADEGEQR
jgi:hypothetical protein